jgi:hypothetical protein
MSKQLTDKSEDPAAGGISNLFDKEIRSYAAV